MKVSILQEAQVDLLDGFRFYEKQQDGLGDYFLDCLYDDIDLLEEFAGTHEIAHGYHRSLSKKFPFAIFYRVNESAVEVFAVLDCRRDPAWIEQRLH